MKPASPESASHPDYPPVRETSWSYTRWTVYLLIAFAAHVGLIYSLGNRKPVVPRTVKNDVKLSIAVARNEFLELQDPSVFAGPHRRGFAASTWLRLPNIPYPSFRWTEPPRLLALATESLGTLFLAQSETNATTLREIPIAPTPVPTILAPLDPPTTPTQSFLRLSPNLVARKLENALDPLPLQRAQDGLTNSVVRVLVDAAGRTFSPTLLPPGSNSRDADQFALKIASALKFSPLKTAGLTVGTLVFEWETEPSTNNVPR
jgi:hypothetical protein